MGSIFKGSNCHFRFDSFSVGEKTLNSIAVRTAKTLWSFGRSECSRIKGKNLLLKLQILSFKSIVDLFFEELCHPENQIGIQ